MIPKIIHYCWFGGHEIPKESVIYIQEWKEFNPEWEIVLWNEQNSPMDIPYMQKALKERKWANMSNFIRLYALLEQGGIYMDTDVKLIKPLDFLCENSCFFGFEEGEEKNEIFWVNNAVCGAEKSHPFIRESYSYLLKSFDGSEMSNLSGPRMTTELLKNNKGLIRYGYQKLSDVTIYPKEVFYPIHYSEVYKLANLEQYLFPETIAVHVWARTWLSKESLLYIIDDLYRINHQLQATSIGMHKKSDISLPVSINLDESFQNELIHRLIQIADNQYFSKSFVEELLQSVNNLQSLLIAKEGQTKIVKEEQHILLNKNHELSGQLVTLNNQLNIQAVELKTLRQEVQLKNEKVNTLEQFRREYIDSSKRQRQIDTELAIELREHLKTEKEKSTLLEQRRLDFSVIIEKLKEKVQGLETKEKELVRQVAELVSLREDQDSDNNRLRKEISLLLEKNNSRVQMLAETEKRLEQSISNESILKKEINKLIDEIAQIKVELVTAHQRQSFDNSNYEQGIAAAQNEITSLQKAVIWYQETYQKRRLIGIVKDRVQMKLKKIRSVLKIKNKVRFVKKNNPLRKSKILCVIVNHNHNSNAKKLKTLFTNYYETIVVDSGSTEKDNDFINLPNIYYSGLYNYAYETALNNEYEHLLFICSDVIIEDDQAREMISNLSSIDLSKIGVYSPASSGRSHYQCKKRNETGFRIVDFVEGFIFLANMKVLKQFSPLITDENLFGWGIDVAKGYYARKLNLLCILDDEVSVFHPAETGYPSHEAEEQMYKWFASLSDGNKIIEFHSNRVDLIRKGLGGEMKISVIIPCYNQAKYLEDAVYSVFNQTYSDFEIVIVNDGSTDHTDEIAKLLFSQFNQIKYIKQENQGLGAARNTGIKNSSGTFIQFLDADDLLSMQKFNKAIKIFANDQETDIVYSTYLCFEDGVPNNTWTYSRMELGNDPVTDLICEWEKSLSIPVHCFIFKREIIGTTLFDLSLPNHEDWEFHLNIAIKKPEYRFEQESIAYYRIKKTAMSQDPDLMKSGKNMCLANLIKSRKFSPAQGKDLFHRFDYSLVVGIITCKKNIEKANRIRDTWAKELLGQGIKYYFIIGDPSFSHTYEQGDTLYVNCADSYENLSQKVALFYEYVYVNTSFDYVFKIDDDCYINIENIYSTYFWKYNYCGRIVATQEDDLNRTWHFGKCENAFLNITPYNGEYIGPWCGGGFGYFLSRNALAVLYQKKEQICNELYEDKAIGDALRQMDILPSENPNYEILNLQQFNIDHKSDNEATDLVHHVGKDVFKYKVIIELTNISYFNQFDQIKRKYANA
ncbi:MAG TPA: glycosyltransferase [Chitinophagaceae bacterium]